jgi:hypothetical protein
MSDERVGVTGELVRRSDKAVLIRYTQPGGHEVEEWFPRSQITDQQRIQGDTVYMTIPRWLAEDRGVV